MPEAVVDFRELLSRPMDEFEEPKTIPAGHFFGVILRHEFGVTQSEKQTPYVRFFLEPQEADHDVPADQLEGVDLRTIELRSDFWLTPASLFRLRDFLKSLGFSGDRPFEEHLPDTRGARVYMEIAHTTSRDGKRVFANVNSVTGVQD